jgi:Fe2+ transport system protein FeoA
MAKDLGKANSLGGGEGEQRRRHRWGWRGKPHGACAGGHGRGCCEECPLSEAAAGDVVRVTGIRGDEAFRGRVLAMGILPGVTLTVVKGGRRQPLLVALPGSRCVVDRHSSEMIAVRGVRPHPSEKGQDGEAERSAGGGQRRGDGF